MSWARGVEVGTGPSASRRCGVLPALAGYSHGPASTSLPPKRPCPPNCNLLPTMRACRVGARDASIPVLLVHQTPKDM